MNEQRQHILSIMYSGIEAVHPASVMANKLRVDGNELHIGGARIDLTTVKRLMVISVGKAASAMAHEAEKVLGSLIGTGVCICKHGHADALERFTIIEAGHPTPDENSIQAAELISDVVADLHADDILIMLISGGASSLVADLPGGCTLPELQSCFEILVGSGAAIHEINVVRKHLSSLKGGQLAMKAFPASVYTLIISDVLGDDLATIGSGLTAPDESSFDDAKAILMRYGCWQQLPDSIRAHIEKGITKEIPETPKPGNAVFNKVFNSIIAANSIALQAAAAKAKELGYEPKVVNNSLSSNTEVAAIQFIRTITNYDGKLPACLLMGGETTLHVTGKGKGGRNQYFVLTALNEWLQYNMLPNSRVTLLAVGTDGTDGPTDAAGAVIDTDLLKPGLIDMASVQQHLQEFDSYHFFDSHGGLIKTGPTQTNVMDIMIALIEEKGFQI